MLTQLIVLILIVTLFLGIRKSMITRFKLEDTELIYRPENSIHRWGEILLIAGLLAFLFVFGFIFDQRLEPHYFIGALGIFFAFRALMEWIFDRSSRRYTLSILDSLTCIVIFFQFFLFING
ncbi:MAG: DUF4181 domain-containing protein [Bacillota bacterium]|nr:DUF4181 domain-containing protein [Bacillota bacterium]MDW7678819.1 DUF4181 domain-containing protein [Bacillota bacterium]